MPPPAAPLFGLAVGEGTGSELAHVFERAVAAFADVARTKIRVERSPTLYRSFGGVIAAGLIQTFLLFRSRPSIAGANVARSSQNLLKTLWKSRL